MSQRIHAAARVAALLDKYSGHSGSTVAAHSLAERGAGHVELKQASRRKQPSMPTTHACRTRDGQSAVPKLLEA